MPHLQLTDNTEPIDNNDPDEIESHTMRWQEKRLSRTEIEQYSEPNMCKTDIQKEYLLKIREHNLNGATKKPDKIFTYTTDDCWQPNNTDVQAKSDRTSKMVDANVDRMYIMADLQEETILFTIKWQSNGLLTVYPDFNDLAKDPYLIEIDADSRHIYQYAIEIVSQTELKEDDGAAAHVDGQLNVMAKVREEICFHITGLQFVGWDKIFSRLLFYSNTFTLNVVRNRPNKQVFVRRNICFSPCQHSAVNKMILHK